MLSTIRNLRGTMTALYGIPYQDSSEKEIEEKTTLRRDGISVRIEKDRS